MTIASAIANKQQQVADCYTAISNKGGTLPATQDVANMPTAINSISTGGTIDSLTITPTTSQQTITASGVVDGYSPITVNAVTSVIDANIQASNIKSGVTILGVTGNYGGGSSKYGCTIDNLLGSVDANGVYQLPTDTSGDIVFTGIKKFGTYNYAMYFKFYGNANLTHGVSFPDLEEADSNYCLYSIVSGTNITSFLVSKLTKVSGLSALYLACNGTKITTASLPELIEVTANNGLRSAFSTNYFMTSFSAEKLKTVSGTYALYSLCSGNITLTSMDLSALETADAGYALGYLCQGCYKIPEMRFTKLKSIAAGSVLYGSFQGCKEITDIYFNALTTTSFGSQTNQFNNMFNTGTNGTAATSGNVNIHFPSNLQSTISGLQGYPNFGATSGYVTLLFDLPATN